MVTVLIILCVVAFLVTICVIYFKEIKGFFQKKSKKENKKAEPEIKKEEVVIPEKKEFTIEDFVIKKPLFEDMEERDSSLFDLFKDDLDVQNQNQEKPEKSEKIKKEIKNKSSKNISSEIKNLSPKIKGMLIDGVLKKRDDV